MIRRNISLAIFTLFAFFNLSFASEPSHGNEHGKEDKEFDPVEMAMHHIKDAHEFHLFGDITIPLPIILWTSEGLVSFSSSEFHHDDAGHHIVKKKGLSFVKSHEKIYQLEAGAHAIEMNEAHEPTNAKAILLDFSITKNVVTLFLVAILMFSIFLSVARRYKGGVIGAPKKLAGWMEPLILFVRDEIARPNIGSKYEKFMPYLLTVFFFIWIGNILGLIPFISNPNLTGSISVTLTLAIFTLIVQLIHSNKHFWRHIFATPGVPIPVLILLVPLELVGIIIKPGALMIRLFANITAGHIIILSLISVIFINKSETWAALSVPMALFISVLELLVAFLQAYIFTMLSALFIGSAVEEAH